MKMDQFVNFLRPLRRLAFSCRLFLPAVLAALTLAACQKQADTPLIVTRMVLVEGEEVIVTRVVLQTIQVPVVATPATHEVTKPVALDVSFRASAMPVIDPQRLLSRHGVDLVENLFVGLTRLNRGTNQVEPELAYSWEVSDDGRTWTFHLRDDLFWVQPVAPSRLNARSLLEVRAARQVTADDAVYAIRRLCHPTSTVPDVFIFFIIEGCEEANNTPLNESLPPEAVEHVGARAIDPFTLQITLVRPSAYFLTLTTLWPMRPLPVEIVATEGDRWTEPEYLLTSGPFVVSPRSLAGARTTLERNPFWPLPFEGNVDVVNIVYVRNDEESFQLWEGRSLDLAPLPDSERARLLRSSPTKVELVPEPEVHYLAYNFNSPAFRHVEVRRALGAAINRERLIREVFGGRGLPMRHFTPPGSVGALSLETTVGTGYSPDVARHQMAASSLVNCRFMPPVTFLVSASDQALQLAELLRDMWRSELGCDDKQFEIEQVQFGTLLATTRRDAGALRPDLWTLAWAAYFPDAHNWLAYVLHCTDSHNRQNRPCSEADQLMDQAAVATDQETREQLYRQIERLFFGSDGIEPLTPLFVRANYTLRHAWITYPAPPLGSTRYDQITVDATVKELERLR
jgi:oligopeptide transport system substrate-binding protein